MTDIKIHNRFIVFGVGNYNALGIVRSLGKKGCTVDLCILNTDRKRNLVATKSKYVNNVHFCNNFDEGLAYIKRNYEGFSKPPFIITNDDKAQSLIDRDYLTLNHNFYVFNAGNPGTITKYMDKKNILDLAEKHGLKVAKTIVVPTGIVPEGLEYPIITKSISPIVGGWKSDVHICSNQEELIEAYLHIDAHTVLLQKYIEKKNEWCLDGIVTQHGTKMFTPLFSKYNYNIKGYYSPYMTVSEQCDLSDKEVNCYEKLKDMMKEIGYEGVYSAEFLIDENGEYYFSEINFRNSTWSYMASLLEMNLVYIYALDTIYKNLLFETYYEPIPEGYTAMVEPIDYQKRCVERGYPRLKWFKDMLDADCKFYWDSKDLKPWLYMVIHNKEFR